MGKTNPDRQSPQRSISIPPSAWREIEEAMKLDGIDNFSVWALAACRQKAARTKRQHAVMEAEAIVEIAPKLRALLTELENRK